MGRGKLTSMDLHLLKYKRVPIKRLYPILGPICSRTVISRIRKILRLIILPSYSHGEFDGLRYCQVATTYITPVIQ